MRQLNVLRERTMIIYKRGIYELPHDLPHDLKLNKLGNIKKTLKTP